MQAQTLLTSLGCLLRNANLQSNLKFDKKTALTNVLSRSEWKPVLECLTLNCSQNSEQFALAESHSAYISHFASKLLMPDSLDKSLKSLLPVFTHMNGEHKGYYVPYNAHADSIGMPRKGVADIPDSYLSECEQKLGEWLADKSPEQIGISAFLTLLESLYSTIPSPGSPQSEQDISHFDRIKIAAAVGSCISEYLAEKNLTNHKKYLIDNETDFKNEKSLLLYCADMSGIQSFIYTISDSKALKSLRSRSFFLSFFMEHYIDETLDACGLSRVNLLFSGGGHCYLLLPNTEKCIKAINDVNLMFNNFLLDEFGLSLFLANGWTGCSCNDLLNYPAQSSPYKEMLHRVSVKLNEHKMHHYSPSQIIKANSLEKGGLRECKVCGRTDKLQAERCKWCQVFVDLSSKLQNFDMCIVCKDNSRQPDFSLPGVNGNLGFYFKDEKSSNVLLNSYIEIHRVYIKNKTRTDIENGIRLCIADYSYSNEMEKLAEESTGIRRIAVCRMDVDNLGHAFVAGFENPETNDPVKRYEYVGLPRSMAFSRQMSLFFQLYINTILSKQSREEALAVTVVYSGGDDIFIVGAWDDVLIATQRIQTAFKEFSCESLTISGGIGLFDDHHPIRLAAYQTAELEDFSKQQPSKNSVSLFEASGSHTYSWEVFFNEVLNEKEKEVQLFFDSQDERGKAFLYRIVNLLRLSDQEDGKINLARYAYMLSRLQPPVKAPTYELYKSFATKMYSWALNKKDRKQLITACYLYVYRNRV